MDRATNQRLRELDRRLQLVYREAYQTAVKNNEKAIGRLAAFMERDNSDLTPQQLLTAQINYTRQVERNTGILHSIANDMAQSGSRAAQLIQGESLNIYELGYRNSLTSINRQLGFNVDWSIYDRNQLRVLMMDEPKSPFTQVAYNRLGVSENRASRVIIPRLQNQLLQSVILGEGIPQITRRIQNTVSMSLYDARRIARTETLRTANQGRMLGFQQARDDYGIEMRKQWLAAIDDRTRDTHAAIDGEIREMDEAFPNGLMFPLDPAGPPEEIIQCRCTVSAVLKDLDSTAKQELQEKIGKKTLQDDGDGGTITGEKDAIEKQLDSAKGTPIDIQEASKGTNPNYKPNSLYSKNCQRCVPTYELRRRGYDVEALPVLDPPSRDPFAVGFGYMRPFENVELETLSATRKLSYADKIGERMEEWGDGARALVQVNYKGGGYSHIFIAEQVDGKTMFIDPQTNELDISGTFDYVKSKNGVSFGRIDNVDMFDRLDEICKKSGS